MKKLMVLMVGVSLLGGSVSLFAQNTNTPKKSSKSKAHKGSKRGKKHSNGGAAQPK